MEIYVCSLMAMVGLMAGIGAVAVGGRILRVRTIRHRLQQPPLLPVAQVTEGPVVLQGQAVALNTTRTPIGGKEVIGYRVKVERLVSTRRSAHWRTLVDQVEGGDFELSDPSGQALVRVSGGQWLMKREYLEDNTFFNKIPPSVTELLRQHGEFDEGGIFEGQIRWSEYHLEASDDVCVLGYAGRQPDPRQEAESYREPPTKVVLGPPADGPMIIADQHLASLLRSLGLLSDLPLGS